MYLTFFLKDCMIEQLELTGLELECINTHKGKHEQ